MARREALRELGGFNEALYPNEENALMDELQRRGGKLIYDPEFIVHRRPRRSLRAFLRMLMTYGRGRAEQFRLHPTPGSVLNFIPPLFCLYLASIPLISQITFAAPLTNLPLWYSIPLGAYVLALLIQTLLLMPTSGPRRSLAAMPLLMASHFFYGLGFWHGLFTKLKPDGRRPVVPVILETVTR
jgi:cellulose synthase/poly-beta-1,6-N-acetylglucosamine synthase-like glycosyltransferase